MNYLLRLNESQKGRRKAIDSLPSISPPPFLVSDWLCPICQQHFLLSNTKLLIKSATNEARPYVCCTRVLPRRSVRDTSIECSKISLARRLAREHICGLEAPGWSREDLVRRIPKPASAAWEQPPTVHARSPSMWRMELGTTTMCPGLFLGSKSGFPVIGLQLAQLLWGCVIVWGRSRCHTNFRTLGTCRVLVTYTYVPYI